MIEICYFVVSLLDYGSLLGLFSTNLKKKNTNAEDGKTFKKAVTNFF
jgi:hypothetical protein